MIIILLILLILVTPKLAATLQPLQELNCSHKTHRAVGGMGDDGKFNSAVAAHYPAKFNKLLAEAMSKLSSTTVDEQKMNNETCTYLPEITSIHDDALDICETVQAMSEREAVETIEAVLYNKFPSNEDGGENEPTVAPRARDDVDPARHMCRHII